jgi:vacuolar-type H+-ATPase subunit E/Vma4
MPLERITQTVLGQAQAEADKMVAVAKHAAEDRVSAAREAADREAEHHFQQAVRALEEEHARDLIQIKGAANKALLAQKNACLRVVFDKAKQRILALPKETYVAVMKQRLELAVGTQGGQLRAHSSEQAIFSSLLSALNAGRAPDAQVRLDKGTSLPEPGGFILISEQYQVDQTLATLLQELERDMAPEIAKALFGGPSA